MAMKLLELRHQCNRCAEMAAYTDAENHIPCASFRHTFAALDLPATFRIHVGEIF